MSGSYPVCKKVYSYRARKSPENLRETVLDCHVVS